MTLKLDLSKTKPFLTEEEVFAFQPMVDEAHKINVMWLIVMRTSLLVQYFQFIIAKICIN